MSSDALSRPVAVHWRHGRGLGFHLGNHHRLRPASERPCCCARVRGGRKNDLVKTRTQTVNRLHVVLTHPIPAGASRGLSADRAAQMLRRVRPHDVADGTLRGLAVDLAAEVRQLDRRISEVASDI